MELHNKSILITGVESTDKKITLLSNRDKYYFWITKKDGGHTTAYDQFQKFRFNVGTEVEIAVKEEEKTFTNEKGKVITFMDRNIAYFAMQDEHTPKQPVVPKEKPNELEARVAKIEKILNDNGIFEIPVI
jgi:hypothetical protein